MKFGLVVILDAKNEMLPSKVEEMDAGRFRRSKSKTSTKWDTYVQERHVLTIVVV